MSDTTLDIDALDFSKGGGLLPGVVQDADTGTVLMLGYLNRESLQETIRRGRVVFFSRSRQQLWEKGETSGHTLNLVSVVADCDNDALLLRVHPVGPTCHRNTPTCFGDGQPPTEDGLSFLAGCRRSSNSALPRIPRAATPPSCTARASSAWRRKLVRKASRLLWLRMLKAMPSS